MRRTPRQDNNSYTENPSEQDSDSLSDEGLGQEAQGGHRSDEDEFLDCEPTPSGNMEAFERSSAITSTRHATADKYLYCQPHHCQQGLLLLANDVYRGPVT